jgi:hypothetical protein
MVSHDCWAPERPHSDVSCGTTAEAENQTDMARSSARARRVRVRHLPVMGSENYTATLPVDEVKVVT